VASLTQQAQGFLQIECTAGGGRLWTIQAQTGAARAVPEMANSTVTAGPCGDLNRPAVRRRAGGQPLKNY